MMMMSLPMVSLTVFLVMLAGFGVAVAICHSRKPALPQLYDADVEWYDLCQRYRHPWRRLMRKAFGSVARLSR